MNTNLHPFLRPNLDLLFVGLNPPEQSNANGHYFSGKQSRFFELIYRAGLITKPLSKEIADEIVFDGTSVNYKQKAFGVIDLVSEHVMTNSGQVHPTKEHVDALLGTIAEQNPRIVCVIHGKVAKAVNRHGALLRPMAYGVCGKILPECSSVVALNYFPNGNAIPDSMKLDIFGSVRDIL